MINPVFLRTFMSLVKTRHFTHTAEELGMTQPGVSQHIKKLETQLGTELLSRYGKSFELTSAGEHLYLYGLKQGEAEHELKARIDGDEYHSGECRLACSGSMALQIYPELLKLQKQYPKLLFSLEAAPNDRIIEQVRQNQSELGMITQPQNDPKLAQDKLAEETLCLVVPRQSKSDWESLMDLGFVNHPDGYHYAIQVLEANFPDQFLGMDQIPQKSYINQISQILLPVSEGLGFTVLPKAAVDAFRHADKIRSVQLSKTISETIYLVTKKHRPLPVRYQLIKELLTQQKQ